MRTGGRMGCVECLKLRRPKLSHMASMQLSLAGMPRQPQPDEPADSKLVQSSCFQGMVVYAAKWTYRSS